jgi:hypothetical protein
MFLDFKTRYERVLKSFNSSQEQDQFKDILVQFGLATDRTMLVTTDPNDVWMGIKRRYVWKY